MLPSSTHLVLIPSYNPGPAVFETVRGACAAWSPVWVVVDGSTDGTLEGLRALTAELPQLRVLALPQNCGKGAAVLEGLRHAEAAGFTHILSMDSDGQHPSGSIAEFMRVSQATPSAMVLGQPVFDESAPLLRLRGRKVSNWWANLETLWIGVNDSLFGFRVYPVTPLREIMDKSAWMRRFDFDVEAVVRLCWRGVKPVNIPAPCRYLTAEQGGVSHFDYWRDNKLLTRMHTRLFVGFLSRLPVLLWRRIVK